MFQALRGSGNHSALLLQNANDRYVNERVWAPRRLFMTPVFGFRLIFTCHEVVLFLKPFLELMGCTKQARLPIPAVCIKKKKKKKNILFHEIESPNIPRQWLAAG